MHGARRKAVAVALAVVMAFSMVSASAVQAFADQLGAASLKLAGGSSSAIVYDSAYGVFGGKYALMYKDITYKYVYDDGTLGTRSGAVTDIVRADGTVTVHLSPVVQKSDANPGGWTDYTLASLSGSMSLGQGLASGFVGAQLKSTGKVGVKKLDGSDLVACKYDSVAVLDGGGFVGFNMNKSSARVSFFDKKGSACGSADIAYSASGGRYTYGSAMAYGDYVSVTGAQEGSGDVSAVFKKSGASYAQVGGASIVGGDSSSGQAVVVKGDTAYYCKKGAADRKLVSGEDVRYAYIYESFISLDVGSSYETRYYNTAGKSLNLGKGSLKGTMGDYALVQLNYLDDGSTNYGIYDSGGARQRTLSAYNAYVVGNRYYCVTNKSGDAYKVDVCKPDGTLVKTLTTSWYKGVQEVSDRDESGKLVTVGYRVESGTYTYYDLDFNELSGRPAAAHMRLADGRSVCVSGSAVTDGNEQPIVLGGYTLAVDRSNKNYGSFNTVRRGESDVWWAKSSAGKWGAVSSSGAVKVPFKYDSYYDAGLADAAYALAKRDGKWVFVDAGSGKEYSRTSLASASVTVKASYTGKALKLNPAVKYGSKILKLNSDYTLSYLNASKKGIAASKVITAGTYYVKVSGKGEYTGSVTKKFTVSKAANPMSVTAKSPSVKYGKKAQTVKASSAYKFAKKAAGTVTYSRVAKGSSAWLPKVDSKTGAITVKAGAPKGKTYSVNVKVAAKGNANYKSAAKTVTVKVKVS